MNVNKIIKLGKLKSCFDVQMEIPGSKSITNRAILIASISDRKVILKNVLESEDTFYMKNAMKSLGVRIEEIKNGLVIYGKNTNLSNPKNTIYIGNSGITIRFLVAIISFCQNITAKINGCERMKKRPIGDLVKALQSIGVKINAKNNFYPPVSIIAGKINKTMVSISGKISSQYLSALLIASVLLDKNMEIKVDDNLVSKPYIDLTIDIMKKFGVNVFCDEYRNFKINKNSKYFCDEFVIEPDASSASYFFAIAMLSGSRIKIKNISKDSLQGDIKLLDLFEKMGAKVEWGKNFCLFVGSGLKNIKKISKFDFSSMPDVSMTMMVVLAFCNWDSEIVGLKTLRIKECDRLQAMKDGFENIGIKSDIDENSIKIYASSKKLKTGIINPQDDHRIAMSFSIASVIFPDLMIKNPNCVAKTYPNFWQDLAKIGVPVKNLEKNLVLIGMRASGKTTIGKKFAKKNNMDFVDIDKKIEKKEKMKINQIIAKNGWDYFRDVESEIIQNISKMKNIVISTGGGAILREKNIKNLRKNSFVVFLKCDLNVLKNRIKKSKNRPSLTNDKKSYNEVIEIWEQRKEIYFNSADYVVNCSDFRFMKKFIFEITEKFLR